VIPDGRTPVMVVTGFLGSGKTTLVNQLLKKQSESLVIVNEFGDVSIDHHLLEATEERVVALPNGCLCCRLRGDLEETLRTRKIVERAKGVLMRRYGLDEGEAFARIQKQARDARKTMREVAEAIVHSDQL